MPSRPDIGVPQHCKCFKPVLENIVIIMLIQMIFLWIFSFLLLSLSTSRAVSHGLFVHFIYFMDDDIVPSLSFRTM